MSNMYGIVHAEALRRGRGIIIEPAANSHLN